MPFLSRQFKSQVTSNSVVVRSMDEFIADQVKYEEKKYLNLKNAIIRDELAEQAMINRNVNDKSEKILAEKGYTPVENSNVYFEKKQEKIMSHINEAKAKETKYFKPKINLKS